MKQTSLIIAGLMCFVLSAMPQSDSRPGAADFHSTATMVTVPALVRDRSGQFVPNLRADDFKLYDNGIRQSVWLARPEEEPVALVVVIQTGANAERHFYDYVDLPVYLDWLTGAPNHELMLVTFDSRVELIWHFPVRSDGVSYSLTHLHGGDGGAAMLDVVQFAVRQLQGEPGSFRRVVLLIGQEQDEGSSTTADEALRTLGEGSTAVYALTFSPRRTHTKTKTRSGRRRGDASSRTAGVSRIHDRTAAELAAYTGGADFNFSTPRDFNEALKALGADLRNRYALGFQPAAHQPGFHELGIEVPEGLTVTGRGGYWFEPASPNP